MWKNMIRLGVGKEYGNTLKGNAKGRRGGGGRTEGRE